MKRKKWMFEEKVAILAEGEQTDILETCRKYNISRATYYNWKQKLEDQGHENHDNPKTKKEMKRLEDENKRLKQLLAEKDLVISIKEELLKKSTLKKKKG